MYDELRDMIGSGERVLYEGKPNKKCFVFESIFNPLLPIAILWAVFDSFFIGNSLRFGGGFGLFIMLFTLFHLMPVWIYLAGVVFSFRRYKNTSYIVTDHGVYVSSGIFTKNINCKPFAELSEVNLHRGIFDQMFGVGDIILTTNQRGQKGQFLTVGINSIESYQEVYQIVKKLQRDIYSDTMYPNDLRPRENHGYKTKYMG